MKAYLLMPLSITVSVALLCLIQLRNKEQDKESRRNRFQNIKLRVSADVLAEYQTEQYETQTLMEKTVKKMKDLGDEVAELEAKEKVLSGELQNCKAAEVG